MGGVESQAHFQNDHENAAGRGRSKHGATSVKRAVSAVARHPQVVQTIEGEVIPRLLLTKRGQTSAAAVCAPMFGPEDVAEFATRVLARDNSAALAFIQEQRNRGAELDTLYVDLMAPAARHLGEMWVQDFCDFTQVTIGLGRLQQVLHELRNVFPVEHEGRPSERRLLLMPAPGDQHTFGIAMVADLFRRGGWYVRSGPRTSQHDLIETVRADWYSVVGISIGSEFRLESVSGAIRSIRRASRNPSVGIMVGGPLLSEHPDIAAMLGADATAVDGRQAVAQAQNLLTLLARSH
jgi:methanogenic corrinoid protein MtbC1